MIILIRRLALDAQGPGEITGYEDHEALLTKTLSIKRSQGPAGIPTVRASMARRAASPSPSPSPSPNLIVFQI